MSGATPATTTTAGASDAVGESRRQLTRDGLAIAAYALPVGLVFGLTALQAHYSFLDVLANSTIALAGGAQFAAAGLVKDGASWLAIAGVVALINARHLLYSAAIAPYATARSRRERAVMAHFLTDETFALALAHFRRIGRFERRGYWIAAMAIFVPWTIGSCLGYVVGGAVDTTRLGLDIAFPAAMAGLSLGMVSGRRDAAAALGAVVVAVPVGLVAGASLGLVAGALLGPCFGLAVPPSPHEESSAPETPEPSSEAGLP
ncbi:MAG TPA: AzlC family ABC transporter permease [Candidatus Limnocylindrales bacterium]|jgi:4-azaleucine resistance transporter AzlC